MPEYTWKSSTPQIIPVVQVNSSELGSWIAYEVVTGGEGEPVEIRRHFIIAWSISIHTQFKDDQPIDQMREVTPVITDGHVSRKSMLIRSPEGRVTSVITGREYEGGTTNEVLKNLRKTWARHNEEMK